ncbi:MAG: glycosyltransferase [Muribaculaceae bacterium]|nr:glycosyltransferase [Muribaculaceae bacterium]
MDKKETAPVVSVIMPVYNARDYLAESVGSVLSQTYRHFELICFDDASPDTSGEILDAYAASDARVRVIHSAVNVKQGGGRNRAIAQARGRYVLFLDADDRLAPEAIERCVAAADRAEAEAVFFDYLAFAPGEGRTDLVCQLGPDASMLPVAELRKRVVQRTAPVWSAMYARELFARCGLAFPEGVFYEDNAITLALQLSAARPVKIDGALYHYRCEGASVTRSSDNPRFFDRIASAETLMGHLRRLGIYEEPALRADIDWLFVNQYLIHTVFGAIYRFSRVQRHEIAKVRKGVRAYVPHFRSLPGYRRLPVGAKVKIETHLLMPGLIKALSRANRALHRHLPKKK